jgi:hypothetical protein
MAYTTIDKPTDYFNTVLYTGNDTDDHAITGVNFQPDFVWIKSRSVANNHNLYDVIRGVNKPLKSNRNASEFTRTDALKSFDSDGFTLDDDATSDEVNNNGVTYASWNWLAGGTASSNSNGSITSSVSASTTAGFSVVSYTGTGSNATVGHGLSSAPSMIIFKARGTGNWLVYHQGIGNTHGIFLNTTSAKDDDATYFQDTNPTSSVFSIGTSTLVNDTNPYIAYCFAEKKGYSKFGSYTGNGDADGTFVYTGFKPAFFICKRYNDSGYDWLMYDNKRQVSFNVIDDFLKPNLNDAETTGNANQSLDFLSNGVKHRGNGASSNGSGASYIYMAFAESPFVNSNGVPNNAR